MHGDDLKKRTKAFASAIIRLYCSLPRQRTEVRILSDQMLRSGTSVAANYREASRPRSNPDFISKTEICIQEADETQLWLELLRDDCGINHDKLDWLLQESGELIAIFVTMVKKVKNRISK